MVGIVSTLSSGLVASGDGQSAMSQFDTDDVKSFANGERLEAADLLRVGRRSRDMLCRLRPKVA